LLPPNRRREVKRAEEKRKIYISVLNSRHAIANSYNVLFIVFPVG